MLETVWSFEAGIATEVPEELLRLASYNLQCLATTQELGNGSSSGVAIPAARRASDVFKLAVQELQIPSKRTPAPWGAGSGK